MSEDSGQRFEKAVVNSINILRAAFAPIFLLQKITKTVNREKLYKALLYSKGSRKILMKLTPGRSVEAE